MVAALMIKPGEHPTPALLVDDGDFLDCAVSIGAITNLTAMTKRVEKGIVVLYGDEAIMLGGIGNRCIDGRIYAGTIYIVAYQDGVLRSLSDEDIARYMVLLWEPERYTEEEIVNSYLFSC